MKYSEIYPEIKIKTNGDVWLYCPNAKYKKNRLIGKINYLNKIYFSAPKNSKHHLFRADNSLSLPYDLIYRKSKGFIYVCIKFDGKKIFTSSLAFKLYGVIKHFIDNGYEKQIFLPVDKFNLTIEDAKSERKLLRKGVC